VEITTSDLDGNTTFKDFFSSFFDEFSYKNIEFATRFIQMLQIMPNSFAHATCSFIGNENIIMELHIADKHISEKRLMTHVQ